MSERAFFPEKSMIALVDADLAMTTFAPLERLPRARGGFTFTHDGPVTYVDDEVGHIWESTLAEAEAELRRRKARAA